MLRSSAFMAPPPTAARRRRRHALIAGLTAIVVTLIGGSASAAAQSILRLRDNATTPQIAAKLQQANDWWQSQNPGQIPCRKCEMQPPWSKLTWVYYRNQGFFPNWVVGARNLYRGARDQGDVATLRAGLDELLTYSVTRTAPNGTVYRTNDAAYLSPEGTQAPWRGAMSQGMILMLFPLAVGPDSDPTYRARIKQLATEYLNGFDVDWKDGGVATNGTAGGKWYLEYATATGDESRILNGFVQAVVSLHRFATKASELADDDSDWGPLAERARALAIAGALETNAHLHEYDMGGGISRYSLTRPGPAPAVYHEFHRQLLLRLERIEYLPIDWRQNFHDQRVAWGGTPNPAFTPGGMPPWSWLMIGLGAIVALLALLRVRAVRLAKRRRQRLRDAQRRAAAQRATPR